MNKDFTDAVTIAFDERLVLTNDVGMAGVFDLLEHFADGGTIHNNSQHDAEEVVALLGATYASLRLLDERVRELSS